MIYIYCDFEHCESIQPDEHIWVAEYPGDYIPLRQKLRRALDDEDHDITIYLRSPVLTQWLRDMRDYGERIVVWQTVDLHHRFQSLFGFPAPPEFDSAAIQELDLLSLPPASYKAATDPVGWLLGQCLGTVWEIAEPYPRHLSELSAWAMNAPDSIHPALATLQHGRLMSWAGHDPAYNYLLQGDIHKQAAKILARWALQHYPPDFLASVGLDSTPLTDCPQQIAVCRTALEPYTKQIRSYWATRTMTLQENAVQHMLTEMSGLLTVELGELTSYLSRYPEKLSRGVLDQAHQRFLTLSEMPAALNQLNHLMPVPLPIEPSADWTVGCWLEWVVTEYMPYFAWVLRTKQPREHQIALANCFADWLIDQATHLPFDSHAPVLTNQREVVRQLWEANPDGVLVWVIIDGLTWWQGGMLVQACTEHGFFAHTLETWFSMLPSVTSISKRALVQGYQNARPPYRPLVKVWQEHLTTLTNHAQILSTLETLADTVKADKRPGIYALFYNDLDAYNHANKDFTDDEAVSGHLQKITRHLAQIAQHCQTNDLSVQVLISSDHGSTFLPSDAPILRLPKHAVVLDQEDDEPHSMHSQNFVAPRTRAFMLEQSITPSEVKALSTQWYVLQGDVFGLQQTFLIPRGYTCAGRRPRGWTHGGATPEEAVIPFIRLELQPLDVIAPSLSWKGYLLPTKSSTLTVELTNPNAFSLHKVRLVIWNGRFEMNIGDIAARTNKFMSFQTPPATAGGQTQTVTWLMTWEVAGQTYQDTGTVEVPVRRFQVTQDDLFQELK